MSADLSLELLFSAIHSQQAPALWVVDEHGSGASLPPANPAIQIVSNRFDVAQALQKKGWQAEFNDHDFSTIAPNSLDRLFFRIAKEKPLVHHIINSAAQLLKSGGQLLLSGGKQQGIKTYAKSAARCLGGEMNIKKHGNDYLATISRGEGEAQLLDDKQYHQLRVFTQLQQQDLYSKPGQYGWDKIDSGSQLLAEQLKSIMPYKKPNTILDLGCGYGYLSLMAHQQFPEAQITATDNNAAALLSCRKNFVTHGIEGEVIADNCGSSLTGRYKLIISNPPFHQGFDVERDLTELFVKTARRLCHKNGMAIFVVNVFIPIERIAHEHFAKLDILANNGKFKVVAMKL